MNKVTLIGNLTKDLETKFTPNGKSVTTGSLAVQRRYKGTDGKAATDFFNLVIWGSTGENAAKYNGKKGNKLGVSGRIENRSYEAKDGSKKYVTEIVVEETEFLNFNKSDNNDIPGDYFGGGDMTLIEDGEDMPF